MRARASGSVETSYAAARWTVASWGSFASASARPSRVTSAGSRSAVAGSARARRRYDTATSGAPRLSAVAALSLSTSTIHGRAPGGSSSACAAISSALRPAACSRRAASPCRASSSRGDRSW